MALDSVTVQRVGDPAGGGWSGGAFTQAAAGPDGSATAPAYSFSADSNTGMFREADDTLAFAAAGSQVLRVSAGGIVINAASGRVQSRAGTAALPSFTFVSNTNSGLYDTGASGLGFTANGTARWAMNSSGHFMAATDNSFDIGALAATRPRSIYAGTSFGCAGSAGVTAGPFTNITSITVTGGIVTALTGS